MTRVLIFGVGSIGTVYAYILDRARASVTAICRSNYDAARTDGLVLNSTKFGQNLRIRPTVLREVPRASSDSEPFDFVLVTSKAFPGSRPSTASAIAPAVSPGTTIVLIQNGIGIEAEYAAAFPANPLLSCVAYLPATQGPPGTVAMGDLERLEIGAFPAGQDAGQDAAEAFADLLRRGGSDCSVHADVQPRRWSKLLVNAAWNPVCALARAADRRVLDSSGGAEDFVLAVMLEVVAVAAAVGCAGVDEAEARRQLGRAKAREVGVEPSMLADTRGGRPLEIEAILGNVVRLGKREAVPVVRLETLYTLLMALDHDHVSRQRSSG